MPVGCTKHCLLNGNTQDDVKEDCSHQKLKMKQQEFENSFKQKIRILVPLAIGCVWEDTKNDHPNNHLAELKKYEVGLSSLIINTQSHIWGERMPIYYC